MRQFVYIAATAYVIVGLGTGLVFYAERQRHLHSEARPDDLVVGSVMTGLFWPFNISAVLTGHDSRKLS